MKKITIPYLDTLFSSPEEIAEILDEKGVQETIETVNWKEFPYQPQVSFAMAYNENHLFLNFKVQEQHIRAMETETNGNVWEDSCCEFFCAFDDEGYYNIETNCIGTQLIGWGANKEERTLLNPETIDAVQKHSTLKRRTIEPQSGRFEYQLTLIIPAATFVNHPGVKFTSGMQLKGNFYKCGDKTPEPHFISWNPIEIEDPNFHRPDFFGVIELA
ncbi:carbohydrate-binding family 9-like protein [Marinilabilia salmonicolor]|uniref:Cellulose/xylan binding protein with CBM9 domain n=1 Tax=Marinilabilia salmonicolor TaxID=989 RepID=A0A368US35_9BACT|nr:carbohydrate-binding family 9-like protein [Marinilabilia salmonicolor]RCW31592.1 cellulose/xylan binding protein with CBM9 domain [Marinilabilia salmonicolor]